MRHYEPFVRKVTSEQALLKLILLIRLFQWKKSLKNQRATGHVPPFYIYGKEDLPVIVDCVNERGLILMHRVDLLSGSARNVKFMRMKCQVRDMI